MELQYNELSGTRMIKLIGKLDIDGTNTIQTQFANYCSGEKPHVLVDLSEVDFLASVGIRLLTSNAKSVASRGGKLVILNPAPKVKNVLETTGIPAIIPMYDNLESAQTVLMA